MTLQAMVSESTPPGETSCQGLFPDNSQDDKAPAEDDRSCAKQGAGKTTDATSDEDGGLSSGDEAPKGGAQARPLQLPVPPSGLRRRSGIQTSERELFAGLKATFAAMERLDVSPRKSGGPPEEDDDALAYIRLLKPGNFVQFLEAHHVPVEEYGRGRARCLRDLWAEVVTRLCNLEEVRDPMGSFTGFLQRRARILVLEVKATLEGQERFLLLKQEANVMGHIRDNLDSRVTKKMFDDEDIPSAVHRCLLQTFNMQMRSVEEEFAIESAEDVEELRDSTAYPGLRTIYTLHLVYLRVREASRPRMAAIGLPSGRDFTARMMGSALDVDKSRTWCWCTPNVMAAARMANQGQPTSPRRSRRCKTLTDLGST